MAAPFHQIVVPTDFSPDADRAILAASELSRLYAAPLTIIHVYDPVAFPLPDGYMMYTSAQLSEMWEEFERRLAQARRDALAAGALGAQTRLLQGLTAAEIVRFAKDEGYDLIVMGTHGRHGVARVLLGSVAARVVQTAECPVLTVRRRAQRAEAALHEAAAAGTAA
ncbi:MAG TPA: universal stress protein [Polyangiaceae bacterium]|nr:universal stress protein [Polyangiaceae bacterium]